MDGAPHDMESPKGNGERKAAPGLESERRRRMRSIAIAVSLALLVLLFYAATIVRLGGNVANRAL